MRSKFAGLFCFVFIALGTLYFAGTTALANNNYVTIAAGAPLLQDWTDVLLLDNVDDWTQVVAIEAFSGAGLAPVPGTDARTILADNPVGSLRITPNQSDPIASTADGVAEFELANPTVALRGSDTASAPNIVIHVNTTIGCAGKAVSVRYDVRDIDASANNAISQVNTQYRIGGTGNYTNVPFAYLPDGSSGPGTATLVSPRLVTLPIAATGQPMVDIRIMTVNAVGTDEWLGIDNIRVDCVPASAGMAVVSGQVRDSRGRGISRAVVSVTDPNSGVVHQARTNPFGYYQIDGLEVGSAYVVTIGHKAYTFINTTQSLLLLQDTDGVDFEAN